jgi:hypothetical protein
VCALEEDAPAVEGEVAIDHPQLAEATTDRVLMGGAALDANLRSDAVETRVFQIPGARLSNLHGQLVLRKSGGKLDRLLDARDNLADLIRGNAQSQRAWDDRVLVVAHRHRDGDPVGMQVGPDEKIRYVDRRHAAQRHGIGDAAHVGRAAGPRRIRTIGMRDLFEHVAVDGGVGGVEHPHRQQVVGVQTDGLGDVELERGLPTLIAPDVLAVQPDLSQVVHRAEAQQETLET